MEIGFLGPNAFLLRLSCARVIFFVLCNSSKLQVDIHFQSLSSHLSGEGKKYERNLEEDRLRGMSDASTHGNTFLFILVHRNV
jgi:hypothetical protein